MTGEPLLTEISETGVAVVTFNRPELRNAIDAAQWDRLGDRLDELAANAAVRCLAMRGNGGSFAAGGDLKTLLKELETIEGVRAFRARIGRCLSALRRFPRPTIAYVDGPAIGGGLEIAVSCDIRIASPAAKFGMPAARFGMVMAREDFIRLASVVGVDRARFLAITTEVIDAATAHAIGLVHEIAPSGGIEALAKWTRRMLAIEPEALAWFRNAALALEQRADLADLAALEEECLMRPEFRRRVEDFLKR